MKKTLIYAAMAAVAVLSACTKENPSEPSEPQGKCYEVTALNAKVEGCDEGKTYLTSGGNNFFKVYWQSNDKITLMSNGGSDAEFTLSEGTGSEEAVFTGELSSTSAPFFAVYPSRLGATKGSGKINFSLPQTQAGSVTASNGVMPAIAYIPDPTESATFMNLCGIFRIKLTGSATVSRLELYDLGGGMLWGDASLKADATLASPDTWVWTLENGDNKLVLDFSNNMKTLSGSAMTFYFIVPQGTLASGARVIIYDENGTPIDEFCTAKDMTIERSVVKPMKAVAVTTNTLLDLDGFANCYIADPSATSVSYKFCEMMGNTNTALGAASAEELWETLCTNTTFNSGNKGYVIKNVTHYAGCVSFKVNAKEGNAVIAARNAGGDILWSWHVWLPYYGTVEEATMGNGVISMDRNLGAKTTSTSDTSIGFLYQWGRKDPFTAVYHVGNYSTAMTTSPTGIITSELKSDATVAWSILHPTTFVNITSGGRWDTNNAATWAGDNKTISDPCPAGWRVPSSEDYNGLTIGDWDATNFCRTESASGMNFSGTGRRYYSANSGKHVLESAQIGRYWTRTHGTNQATERTVNTSSALASANTNKVMGLAIRCVKE